MWRVKGKYLQIELWSYLEFKHTQALLQKVSQDFRRILISGFKQIKNISRDQEKHLTIDTQLYLNLEDPSNFFIAESLWNEIQVRETHYLDLTLTLNILNSMKYADITLKKLEQKNIFGKVNIRISQSIDAELDQNCYWLYNLHAFFSLSKSISFDLNFANIKSRSNFISSIPFQECSIKSMELLKLNVSLPINLSVKCLQNVRQLILVANKNDSFILQFEDLSITYLNTNFSLQLYNYSNLKVQQAYTQWPKLFATQCCKIICQFHQAELNYELQDFKKSFPICPLELTFLKFDERYKNAIQCLEQLFVFESPLVKKVIYHYYYNAVQFCTRILASKLFIQQNSIFSQSLFIETLSKFQISDEIEIHYDRNLDVIQHYKKFECPKKISIHDNSQNEKNILGILNGFCKYENVEEFNFFKNKQLSPQLNVVFIRLEHFKNIKALTLPINEYLTQSVLHLIKSLRSLSNLRLQCTEENEKTRDIVSMVSIFAIENLKNLRKLDFDVTNPIDLQDDIMQNRAQPLTITVLINQKIQFIIDARFGIRKTPLSLQYP
ncbi:hypothetical protein FGO68_gene11541 [Halteria grandinella]|uniref:Uncharacterized protein n=1 Tax=Halteria grandinella TaxID=5974 RepID=A0A8J8P0V6_HALGN|nr:hypothetical protein FGO68_gene11541 [Halteria grandinella]